MLKVEVFAAMAEPGPAVAGADLAAAAAAAVETAAAARSAPATDMLEQLKKEKAELRKRSAEVVRRQSPQVPHYHQSCLSLKEGLFLSWCDEVPGRPRQSQKPAMSPQSFQEDQET